MYQNCYSTSNYDGVQELKLLELRLASNCEFSEIEARLTIKENILQVISTELIIDTLRKSVKENIQN